MVKEYEEEVLETQLRPTYVEKAENVMTQPARDVDMRSDFRKSPRSKIE